MGTEADAMKRLEYCDSCDEDFRVLVESSELTKGGSTYVRTRCDNCGIGYTGIVTEPEANRFADVLHLQRLQMEDTALDLQTANEEAVTIVLRREGILKE